MLKKIMGATLLLTASLSLSGQALASDEKARPLDSELLFLHYLNLNQNYDYDAISEKLTYVFRNDVYARYRSDEFEFDDKKKETVEIIKKRAAGYSTDTVYMIRTSFQFGDYDFDKQVFPLDAVTSTSYYTSSKPLDFNLVGGNKPSTAFDVFFSNPTVIGDLDMPKDEAKVFLQKRKQGSRINRQVYADLKFKIKQIDELEPEKMIAELISVEIFSDREGKTLIKKFL